MFFLPIHFSSTMLAQGDNGGSGSGNSYYPPCEGDYDFDYTFNCQNSELCLSAKAYPNSTHLWAIIKSDGYISQFGSGYSNVCGVINLVNCEATIKIRHKVVTNGVAYECVKDIHVSCIQPSCDFEFSDYYCRNINGTNYGNLTIKALTDLNLTHKYDIYRYEQSGEVLLNTYMGTDVYISYPSSKKYIVKHTVSNGLCSKTCIKEFNFDCPSCDNPSPYYTVTKLSDSPCKYKILESVDNTPNTNFYWNFGDGQSETVIGGVNNIDHIYNSNGNYTVCLKKITTLTNNYEYTLSHACCPININCTEINCEDSLGFDIKSVTGCSKICLESKHKVGTHNWMVTHNGVTVNGTGYTPCFIIPSSNQTNKALYIKQQVILTSGDTCEFRDTLVLKCNDCFLTYQDNIRPDTCGKIFKAHTTGAVLYIWDFGDGSPIVTTATPTIAHDYLTQGPFTACVTAIYENGDISQCCVVVGCYCCSDPEFNIEFVPTNQRGPSCLNVPYRIVPKCNVDNTFMRHRWIFEDGTIFEGANPPNHIFTDFINDDNQVCVTHEIYCGGNKYTATHCIDFYPGAGAIIGYAGETRKYTDPIKFSSPFFSDQTIRGLIQYCLKEHITLKVDGKLVIDEDASLDGTWGNFYANNSWYMAKESEIEVLKDIQFIVYKMNIFSAAKIGYSGCCSWKGITARPNTLIYFAESNISHADRMLRFEKNIPSEPASSATLYAINNVFEEDSVGIFSNEQLINIVEFENNIFRGILMNHVCSCESYVGIWLKNVDGLVIFPAPTGINRNQILNYKMGIYLENSPGEIKNFKIFNIDTYGLNFTDTKANNRIVTLDFLNFNTMPVAIQLKKNSGSLFLNAIATSTYKSLTAEEVKIGYDILMEGAAQIVGNINFNRLKIMNVSDPHLFFTDKMNNPLPPVANGHFGIRGTFATANNTLNILNDSIDVNGLAPAQPFSATTSNAGISLLNNTLRSDENFRVHKNVISIGGSNNRGVGISVFQINKTNIYNNKIELFGDSMDGIFTRFSDKSIVRCNRVEGGLNGMLNIRAGNNIFTDNYLQLNKFSVQLQGTSPNVKYKRNTFDAFNPITGFGILFSNGALTGNQDNDGQYNSFVNWPSNTNKNWVNKTITTTADNTLNNFWRVGNFGTVFNPRRSVQLSNWFIQGIPAQLSTVQCIDEIPTLLDSIIGGGDEEMIYTLIQNNFFENEATSSQVQEWKQYAYNYIADNSLTSTHATALQGWYSTMQNSTFSNVKNRENALSSLVNTVATVSSNLNIQRTQLDALRTQIDDLVRLKDATTNLTLKQQYVQQLVPMFANYATFADALQTSATSITTTYNQGVLDAKLLNNSLNTSTVAAQNDQLLNQIVLNRLSGLSLTTSEEANLWSIATQCYEDGGTAVPAARAYLLQWFGRYILDEECFTPVAPRATNESIFNFECQIIPNPSNQEFTLTIPKEMSESKINITIMDMNGRQLQRFRLDAHTNKYTIETKVFSNGVYILRVHNETGKYQSIKFAVLQ